MNSTNLNHERANRVALDMDGTLQSSQDWENGRPLGGPTAGAQEFVRELLDSGREVIIFSARINETPDDPLAIINGIVEWLEQYGFEFGLTVTGEKPAAAAYIDDRAIRFRGDWDEVRTALKEPVWTDRAA